MADVNPVALVLAALMALVLLGFGGLIVAGKVLDARRQATSGWAYIGPAGAPFNETLWDDARPLSHGLGAVRQGTLWGYVDARGELAIPPRFEAVRDFDGDHAAAKDPERHLWGVIDRAGRWVVEPEHHDVVGVGEGIAVVRARAGLRTSRVGAADVETSTGLLRLEGGWLIAPAEDRDDPERLLDARIPAEGLIPVRRAAGWSFFDLEGQEVLGGPWDNARAFSEGRAAVAQGQAWGFIDVRGQVSTPPQYLLVREYSEGLGLAKTGEAARFLRPDGTPAFEGLALADANPFSEGLAAARAPEGGWGFIDAEGNWALSPRYDQVYGGFSGGLAAVRSDGEDLLINPQGEVLRRALEAQPVSEGVGLLRIERP